MTFYLACTLAAVAIQGLFALFEMACVSFNRVRLQYYASQGTRRALWLNHLLKRPSRLFGTTLIGINTALVIGSECARRFYESIHLDPDWAPLTQIFIVVVFGELAPMFAARRHPEQVAMACVPLMILISRILSPLIWFLDALSRLVHRLMGKKKDVPLFLSREEVKMAFEEKDEAEDEFNETVGRIFKLKCFTAGQVMTPLAKVQMAPSHITIAEMKHLLSVHYTPIIPIYHRYTHNIVAVAYLRDLLRLDETKKAIEKARSPWFVTRDTSILQIIEQFRRNNQSVAVILDPSGQACGLLTLDQILEQIFGEEEKQPPQEEAPSTYVERTLSGEMSVVEFNRQFQADLPLEHGETLNDLILSQLHHLPVKGEAVRIGTFEFTVDEPTLRGIKTLSVHSIPE